MYVFDLTVSREELLFVPAAFASSLASCMMAAVGTKRARTTLFPVDPNENGPATTTLRACSMSTDPEEEDGSLQFFLVDRQETGYFHVPQRMRKDLPPFNWFEDQHEILQLHLRPSESTCADAEVFNIENQQESLGGQEWDDLFDVWMNKGNLPRYTESS